jgi:NTE family protein
MRALLAAAFALSLAGCSSTAVMNKPLVELAPPNDSGAITTGGYRRASLASNGRSPELFVALAFSGGGKRSAAFSYGVLRGLREYRITVGGRERSLLDELSAIHSVSGGSFTSAYYGLYRDKIFTEFERDFLKRDMEAYIFGIYLLPWKWDWMWDPFYGTNDKMAEIYDETIFRGATYGDLLAKGLPFVSVNATDVGNGSVFSFNQEQFDMICSDLSAYPLARAVAASNGFPILFTPITLQNYAEKCEGRTPRWIERARTADEMSRERYLSGLARRYLDPNRTKYVHLMDGGIADNLAMRAMINTILAAGGDETAYRGAGVLPLRRLLIISADGQAASDSAWSKQRTIPGLAQIFSAVSGTQIDSYNFETLLLAKSNIADLVENVRRVRCRQAPVIGRHPCGDVEGYFLHLSLADIADPAIRERLERIPTGLSIPDEDVDTLVAMGEQLVRDSRVLDEFRRSLVSAPTVAARR